MIPLIEGLYHMALENWSVALGLLEGDEYGEYQRCCRFMEEEKERLIGQLTGNEQTVWKRYLANLEQVQDTEHRLSFARGLSMGLSLAALAKGE